MTIALGILTKGGFVIAADTQETYSGFLKLDQSKILGANGQHGHLFVTGAGSSAHIDAAAQELCDSFIVNEPANVRRLDARIKAHTIQFATQHIAPFTSLPDYDRPGLSLLIGAQIRRDSVLWATDKSVARVCSPGYGAVGIGAAHANLLLSRLPRPKSAWVAAIMAAYVLFSVKQSVEGCGKRTQIALVSNGRGLTYWPEVIDKLEQVFTRCMEVEERILALMLNLDEDKTETDAFDLGGQLYALRRAIEGAENVGKQRWKKGEAERLAISAWQTYEGTGRPTPQGYTGSVAKRMKKAKQKNKTKPDA
jgi:hypothetical protein